MVPLMQELVREGVGRASASGTVVAGVAAPVGPEVDSATLADGTAILSGTPAAPYALSRSAGVARLRDEAGRGVGLVAINADVEGARTDVVDAAAVRRWLGEPQQGGETADGSPPARAEVEWVALGNPSAILARANRGTPVSLPLLIAALCVAVAELCMARWFSHALAGPVKRIGIGESAEGAPA